MYKLETDKHLQFSIETHCQITFFYKEGGRRVFLPHILYLNSLGEKILEGYQIGGYSEHADHLPSWKQFDVKSIHHVEILEKHFSVKKDIFNPTAERYHRIIKKASLYLSSH
jgi:hypothetical protein